MMKDLVGYRFAPTGEELINHYLKNKNLGKTWLVDEAINEINICSYHPISLPALAKIQSEDPVWYFFSPKEYTSEKKKVTKRTTASGYWKATGVDRIIKDKRGSKGEMGVKKTLVYYEGRVPKGVRTPWVMHEYHITCLPLNLRTYVICQVMYKGEDGDILLGGNKHFEPSQSLVSSDSRTVRATNTGPEFEQLGQENFDGLSMDELMNPMNEQEPVSLWDVLDPNKFIDNNINSPIMRPEASHLALNDDEFLGELRHVDRGQVEHLFSNEDFISTPTIFMIENCNHYMPKQPLSGVIIDYSSDSDDDDDDDAESTSELSYQGTSSPGDDSICNSNKHFLHTGGDESPLSNTKSCNDVETYGVVSISTKTKTQEVKQVTSRFLNTSVEKKSCIVKTKKKGWFITEEAMEKNHKNPQFIYLMNTMIGFILLLGLIGNIISVLLSVKT